jgi:hypothetical protein
MADQLIEIANHDQCRTADFGEHLRVIKLGKGLQSIARRAPAGR